MRLITRNITTSKKTLKRRSINKIRSSHSKLLIIDTKCNCVCGMRFSKKITLIKHIKICKTAIVARRCCLCGTLFPNRHALEAHKRQTHGSIPCIDCGKKFANAKILAKHRSYWHTTLECHVCGKIFNTSRNLHRHVISHSKPFGCSKCKLRFNTGSSLKDHLSSAHDGVKLVCKECGKSYTHRSNLRAHVQEKHMGMRYFCSNCPLKGFTRKRTMKQHMLKLHGCIVSWKYRVSGA